MPLLNQIHICKLLELLKFFQIVKKTNEKPVKMGLKDYKEIMAMNGFKITGFWTGITLTKITDKRNFDFE